MSAISIATNSANDIYLDSGKNLATVSAIDAVLQDCDHAMRAIYKEMVLNYDKGVPYFETVWNNLNIPQFEGYARDAILAVPFVRQVTSFTVTTTGTTLEYAATILTEYGEGLISG